MQPSQHIKRQRSAGSIIYRTVREGVLFLLLFHSGKYWNFPKGKIENEKENVWDTAIREIEEETGLTKQNLYFRRGFKTTEQYTFTERKQKITKHVTYFLAESKKTNIIISPREHRGYGWFTYQEAISFLKHKNARRNLKEAYDFIQKTGVRRRQDSPARERHHVRRSGAAHKPSARPPSSRQHTQ